MFKKSKADGFFGRDKFDTAFAEDSLLKGKTFQAIKSEDFLGKKKKNMSTLAESWKRTEAHLRRAFEYANNPVLPDFHDYLNHNELELAADILDDFGDEREDMSQGFWEALKYAFIALPAKRQKLFARSIGINLSHIQLSHAADPPGTAERSQRAGSVMFLALGLLSATSLPGHQEGTSIDLVVPENGFISLNVPLTPLRVGTFLKQAGVI